MTRIVVDPVTRIEGHLRIEAVVENGVITDAYSAGASARPAEILAGRDPRDAWAITERVCGVCTTVHALTSVRAVESALGIVIPPTAEIIRNIMMTTQYVQDHVIHFYHLHALDWVDIVMPSRPIPKKAAELAQSFSKWDKNTAAYFSDVQDKIKAFAASGLGIFANGYWGHPAYKLPPEVNLIAVAHYLDALVWQKEIVKIHAVFGGKNPHPNYLVGGVPCSINMNEVAAINSERLNLVKKLIDQADEFLNQVYIPDLLAVASFYKDWASYGGGLSNYLSYGEFPTKGYGNPDSFKYARGVVLNRDLSTVHPVNATDAQEIKEYIAHSWYSYEGGDAAGLTSLARRNQAELHRAQPALRDVGRLRQVLVPQDAALEGAGDGGGSAGAADRLLCCRAHRGAGSGQGYAGQTRRRGSRALFHAGTHRRARPGCGAGDELAEGYHGLLMDRVKINEVSTFNGEFWEPKSWPKDAEGVGLTEAPRGALAHWIKIHNGAIENYQLVVPTTWNGSPRDAKQQRSSFEQALIGTPVAKIDEPVEILRTIHSFDPCLACAVHLYDPQGRHIAQVSFE